MKTADNLYKSKNPDLNCASKIFEGFPDGVVIKDENLRYISANKSYCSLFLMGNTDSLTGNIKNKYLTDKNIRLISDADNQVKNEMRPLNYIINTETDKILSITSCPVLADRNFCGLISVVKDITQEEIIKEKFVNRHFKYMNAEKRLQAQRETFVASIGHDLKNPTIAQIRGLELLLKGAFGNFNTEQKEILEMVLDSCRYMNGMLSSLLSTYRNYGGAIKLNFDEFNFISLLNECISEMLYVAKDKGISITTEYENPGITICADRVQIKRVIMNLLSNGIKYAFKDTELQLKVAYDGSFLFFQFENQSPYLTEEKQRTIFARYVSYSGINKELGIGLGLYASNKIIKSHSGEMFVQSSKENRNIFGFKIPVEQHQESEVEICL